ncbi:unnamed protein product [Calypogeia fissa]
MAFNLEIRCNAMERQESTNGRGHSRRKRVEYVIRCPGESSRKRKRSKEGEEESSEQSLSGHLWRGAVSSRFDQPGIDKGPNCRMELQMGEESRAQSQLGVVSLCAAYGQSILKHYVL